MKTIKVQDGQNIFDIALQYYGDVSAIVRVAQDNGISITQNLTAGQELKIGEPTNKIVQKYFEDRKIVINTDTKPALGDFNQDFSQDFN
jgi:hypothetical protein